MMVAHTLSCLQGVQTPLSWPLLDECLYRIIFTKRWTSIFHSPSKTRLSKRFELRASLFRIITGLISPIHNQE